ncbi:BolA family transcriptional regulator [Gammaproteobacteria bacterium]|jgi:BolA protein|nr:BolA family transcriptional regulator [Gammaproteobacteria bacterium]
MSEKRMKLIKDGLQSLNPLKIDIVDEGHLHVGHAGAKSGGHFKLYIVSEHFKGQSMVNRHKLIYQNLDELMKTEVHALSIKAVSPEEL